MCNSYRNSKCGSNRNSDTREHMKQTPRRFSACGKCVHFLNASRAYSRNDMDTRYKERSNNDDNRYHRKYSDTVSPAC